MEPSWQPTTFPTPRHERVYELLSRLISRGTADFFADACDIVQRRPPYRTTVHMVSHLMREVESATRQILRGHPEVRARLPEAEQGGSGKAHLTEVEAILGAFELGEGRRAREWRAFVNDDGWHRGAHRNDLMSPRQPDVDFEDRFHLFVEVLWDVLDAAEARFASVLDELDSLVETNDPTVDEFAWLATHLAAGASIPGYVADKLPPEWLLPLREHGAFTDPPNIKEHPGGSFSFPAWAQSAYLRRLAPTAPNDVAETILTVPPTNNQVIHLEFLEAATRMPPALAARVARHEAVWLDAQRWLHSLIPQAVMSLCEMLSNDADAVSASALLSALLSLESAGQGNARGVSSKIPDWNYDELVRRTIPMLARADGERARQLLIELIETCSSDESSSWRRAIEDHRQNYGFDPRESLIVQLRDVYEQEVRDARMSVREAVSELENHGSPILNRLALHLLRLFGHQTPDLVLKRATDQQLLDSLDCYHELSEMIRRQFGSLDVASQSAVLAALRRNASVEHLKSRFPRGTLDEQELRRRASLRFRNWLGVLGAARLEDSEAEYSRLCEKYGAPEHPTFRSWSGEARFGPQSPKTVEELLELTDPDLLSYLKQQPDKADFDEPSVDGLAIAVKNSAKREPERFWRLARDFKGLDPAIVSGLFWGLNEAERLEDESSLDLSSLIELAEWVSQGQVSDGLAALEGDDRWAAPRRMATGVLLRAFVVSLSRSDLALTDQAWQIVLALLDDADPTSSRVRSAEMDFATFSINTVRGEALHTALAMASELDTAIRSRNMPRTPFRLPVLKRVIQSVLRKLDRFIRSGDSLSGEESLLGQILAEAARRADPAVEPCGAIRAVLAQRMHLLISLDPPRAQKIAADIFPKNGGTDDELGAWQLFLDRSRPSGSLYTRLQKHYQRALARAGSSPEEIELLGKHLAWLVIRGDIQFSSARDPLWAFIDRFPTGPRHRVLEHIGLAFHNQKETVDDDVLQRMRRFWDSWRAASLGTDDSSDLRAFGWWFGSSAFDPVWCLQELAIILKATGGSIDSEDRVVDRLSEWAGLHPHAVADCTATLVVSGDQWRVVRLKLPLRAILEALRETDAAPIARQIASRLVARGSAEFRDLTAA